MEKAGIQDLLSHHLRRHLELDQLPRPCEAGLCILWWMLPSWALYRETKQNKTKICFSTFLCLEQPMFDVPDAGVYSNYKNPVRNCKQVWPSGCWCVDLDTSRFLTQYQQFGREGGCWDSKQPELFEWKWTRCQAEFVVFISTHQKNSIVVSSHDGLSNR